MMRINFLDAGSHKRIVVHQPTLSVSLLNRQPPKNCQLEIDNFNERTTREKKLHSEGKNISQRM